MSLPSGAIGDGPTRTLLAVLSLPRPTVRAVTAEAGFRSTSTVWAHLKALRALGLVAFEVGRPATTRATVRVVPKIGSVSVRDEWWG
jgi:hypothetical protein